MESWDKGMRAIVALSGGSYIAGGYPGRLAVVIYCRVIMISAICKVLSAESYRWPYRSIVIIFSDFYQPSLATTTNRWVPIQWRIALGHDRREIYRG